MLRRESLSGSVHLAHTAAGSSSRCGPNRLTHGRLSQWYRIFRSCEGPACREMHARWDHLVLTPTCVEVVGGAGEGARAFHSHFFFFFFVLDYCSLSGWVCQSRDHPTSRMAALRADVAVLVGNAVVDAFQHGQQT